MNKAMKLIFMAAMSGAIPASALAAEAHSGFLGDYSQLASEKDAAGNPVMRYISPKLVRGAYQKVLIDPVQFYPAPKGSEYVDESTLAEIRNYVDKGFRERMSAKFELATEPGPGVLRFRPAITAVAANSPGLKPYELLPVGFLISNVKGRGKEAAIQIEMEVTDSASGERLAAAVRKGVGAKLDSNEKKLKLGQLRPLLDQWIDTGSAFATERIK